MCTYVTLNFKCAHMVEEAPKLQTSSGSSVGITGQGIRGQTQKPQNLRLQDAGRSNKVTQPNRQTVDRLAPEECRCWVQVGARRDSRTLTQRAEDTRRG